MRTISLLLAPVMMFFISINGFASTSEKKTEITLPGTQVVEQQNLLVGARIGAGNLFYFGANGEYMWHDNFGAIADVRYGTYGEDIVSAAGVTEVDGSSISLAAQGSFHFDILKVKNLDTYVSAGAAYHIVSADAKFRSSIPGVTVDSSVSAGTSFVELIAYANARYFFRPQWAVQASVGKGLGTVIVGADYLF